jgi:hypothetical protein
MELFIFGQQYIYWYRVSNPGSGTFAYSGDDYASYNLTGGTATAAAPSDADKSAANPYPNG